MPTYQSGKNIAAGYSFEATPRGSTTPITFSGFQKHSYKGGKRDSKEFSVGELKLKQPMQKGAGTHEIEAMILATDAAAWRAALDSVYIIDTADFPDWNTANGPHFVEDYSFEDGIEDMSSVKITISESMGAIAAATA